MAEAIFQTWSAARIAEACAGQAAGDLGVTATAVSNDSRKVMGGELFVALRAERDGHEFIADARKRGARLFLVDAGRGPEPAAGEAVITVSNTFEALERLGRALWTEHVGCRRDRLILGVTGSNGKTTTKDLVTLLLSGGHPGQVLKTEGNLNNHIGLPMTLARLSCRHRFAVLEMGASRVGDIALLTRIAPVNRAAVTSIAPAHLEGLGTEQQVVLEKGAIFRAVPAASVAVVPRRWRSSGLVPDDYPGEVRTFGSERDATVRLVAHRPGPPAGVTLRLAGSLAGDETELAVELGLVGHHNGLNLAAAVALVWDLLPVGSAARIVREAAAAARAPAGRTTWCPARSGAWVLDDTYNANPGSLMAALAVVRERPGRHWLILGDMLELGEAAGEQHREAGRVAAAAGCERVWGVGDWAEEVAEAAHGAGVSEVATFVDAESCARAAAEAVDGRDVVLVKGSRGVGLEVVVAALVEEVD